MRRIFFDRIEDAFLRVDHWTKRHPEVPRTALVVIATVFAVMLFLAALPLFLAAAVVLAVVLFARAWLREFGFLMGVDDSAFPGRNDKLIWAMLLIVLPPLGVYLFRAHRRAYWPESDAKAAMMADELA
jgi:hypothetical protein